MNISISPVAPQACDARNQKVRQTLVKVLQATEVDFDLLGEKESRCGDTIRRMQSSISSSRLLSGMVFPAELRNGVEPSVQSGSDRHE